MKKSERMQLGALLAAMLLVGMAFVVVVYAQGQDNGGKSSSDDKDPLLYDAQIYASNNNVSTEEALNRFQLQDIAGKLDAELSMNETGNFAGLWVEHKPNSRLLYSLPAMAKRQSNNT